MASNLACIKRNIRHILVYQMWFKYKQHWQNYKQFFTKNDTASTEQTTYLKIGKQWASKLLWLDRNQRNSYGAMANIETLVSLKLQSNPLKLQKKTLLTFIKPGTSSAMAILVLNLCDISGFLSSITSDHRSLLNP